MKVPTLDAVNAAWRKAGPVLSPLAADPRHARPYFQGRVEEHLRQQRVKHRGLYRPLTRAEAAAMRLTRKWLEFSP